MNLFNSSIKSFSCLVVAALIAGCAGTVIRPIDEGSKDTSGSYDGDWDIMVQKSPGTQYGPGNWVYNCNGEAGRLGAFVVDDGVATVNFQTAAHSTFVNSEGQFRFEVPMKTEAKANKNSDSSIDRSKMTMIVSGSLEDQSGFLTWGVAEFANDGCTSKVKFDKT